MSECCEPRSDRSEVERLVYIMVQAMDRREPDRFDLCFDADVVVTYNFGTWRGRELHKQVYNATLPRLFSATHHMISNPVVDVSGDAAEAEYYVQAAHVIEQGQKVVQIGLIYRQQVRRQPLGWRIVKHEAQSVWTSDPDDIMPNLGEELVRATTAILNLASSKRPQDN